MSRANEAALGELHGLIARELTGLIRSGEATAAHFATAIKFLKDNGIDCVARDNPDVSSLAETMNFPIGDDDEDDPTVVSFSR